MTKHKFGVESGPMGLDRRKVRDSDDGTVYITRTLPLQWVIGTCVAIISSGAGFVYTINSKIEATIVEQKIQTIAIKAQTSELQAQRNQNAEFQTSVIRNSTAVSLLEQRLNLGEIRLNRFENHLSDHEKRVMKKNISD